MIPEHKHRPEENVDAWLMSYADMITLLLCFFIIFVSVSEPRQEQISAITNEMAGKFGAIQVATPFQETYQELQGIAQEHTLFRDLALQRSTQGLELELASGRFFQPNSAEFSPDVLQALTEMAATLKKIDFNTYHILVEGHTSDAKVDNPAYPSNWEFSAARAARIVRFLITQGIDPSSLKAVGYADTKPEVPNIDANGHAIFENRLRNERVVIKLEHAK